MNIDITEFNLCNVVDTCSVWNILASSKIYSASVEAQCYFSFTKYVEYECLVKPRKSVSNQHLDLCKKLKSEIINKKIVSYDLTIGDLQEVKLLESRKKLGLGELSSIAFAKKTNQAFLTDDKAARKLGNEILGRNKVQTTPHLVGHLFFIGILIDSDLKLITSEHESSISNDWGKLSAFFQNVYEEGMKLKLLKRIAD